MAEAMGGAAPATEHAPPNPDAPPGFDGGIEKVPFENVLYRRYHYNQDEPIFYAPIKHPRCFIPQDKMLELAKYMFVVPKEVEFIIEDVFGVNDFKIDTNSKTPIYVQDIKMDVFSNKGHLTSVMQFYPFPKVTDWIKWEKILENSEEGIYTDLPSCTLKQNRYVQKISNR